MSSSMILPFEKWSGAGNDFIFLRRADLASGSRGAGLAHALCPRGLAVGADGLLVIDDARASFWNSDGSPAAFCGNAARCLGAYLMELSGQGAARFVLGEFPTRAVRRDAGLAVSVPTPRFVLPHLTPDFFAAELGEGGARQVGAVARVAVGVPHLVLWSPQRPQWALEALGPRLAAHPSFAPAGTNVNLCWGEGTAGPLGMRTWERGVGRETLACGTGAVACAALWFEQSGARRVSCRVASGEELVVESGSPEWTLFGPARRVYRGTAQLPAGAAPAGGEG